MAPIAMLFGALMTILGVTLYILAEPKSVTALIPAFIGVLLIGLGMAARNEKARMHAMHGAALLGLIGLIGGIVMMVRIDPSVRPVGFYGNLAMAALSGVFLYMCVRSFIAARRARKSAGN